MVEAETHNKLLHQTALRWRFRPLVKSAVRPCSWHGKKERSLNDATKQD